MSQLTEQTKAIAEKFGICTYNVEPVHINFYAPRTKKEILEFLSPLDDNDIVTLHQDYWDGDSGEFSLMYDKRYELTEEAVKSTIEHFLVLKERRKEADKKAKIKAKANAVKKILEMEKKILKEKKKYGL